MKNIAIPELGYYDVAEDDSGNWEAGDFICSCNFVPVEWIVRLITPGDPLQADRIVLNPEISAESEIGGICSENSLVAVIVSPRPPTTRLELDYELVFQHP